MDTVRSLHRVRSSPARARSRVCRGPQQLVQLKRDFQLLGQQVRRPAALAQSLVDPHPDKFA